MSSIILEQIDRNELKQIIADVFQSFNKPVITTVENEFITREATAKRLGISLPTLNEYSKTGIIISYRLGSRVRYKSTEVEAALLKVQSVKGKRL
jgi:excisionase family DNA binding protein